jgi:hypothetical protein
MRAGPVLTTSIKKFYKKLLQQNQARPLSRAISDSANVVTLRTAAAFKSAKIGPGPARDPNTTLDPSDRTHMGYTRVLGSARVAAAIEAPLPHDVFNRLVVEVL